MLQKALDPNPETRPSTADELAHLLSRTQTHPRNWIRHSANDHTVEYRTTSGSSPMALIVGSSGQRFDIEIRYIASDRRVLDGCFETTQGRLGVELRKLFDKVIV